MVVESFTWVEKPQPTKSKYSGHIEIILIIPKSNIIGTLAISVIRNVEILEQ